VPLDCLQAFEPSQGFEFQVVESNIGAKPDCALFALGVAEVESCHGVLQDEAGARDQKHRLVAVAALTIGLIT
jgi:hypothetical protein